MKKNKGITLVALVITIIILLILAGIAIVQLQNNGLFGKSKEAKQKWEVAQADEDEKIAKYTNKIDNYISGNRDYEYEIKKLSDRITELESAQTTGGLTYETIYSGNANTKGNTYNLSKSINDYKFIIVYASDTNGDKSVSLVIDKSNYGIGASGEKHVILAQAYDSYYYYIAFNFPTDTSIKIAEKINVNWPSGTIYLIKGIK